MVHVASGTMFWRRASPAACIASSGSCGRMDDVPGRAAVGCRKILAALGSVGYLLDRAFEASAPNQRWIADFTYIWTAEAWLYVAAVVDLFSRRVVGWAMKAEMTAQLVTDALIMAIWRRGKPTACCTTRPGIAIYGQQFQRLMADHNITCSMSRAGNVWDNAAMESFFSSLKTSGQPARSTARGMTPGRMFRLHRALLQPSAKALRLGYLSPVEFEEQAMLA